MITKFKVFEKTNEPKYKKGDIVYTSTGKKGTIIKVIKGYYNNTFEMDEPNRYILDILPNLSVREDVLKPEHEIDSEKYNL